MILKLAGKTIEISELVEAVRAGRRETLDLLADQLATDSAAGDDRGDGLTAVQMVLRPNVVGWLRSRWPADSDEFRDEIWQETLIRVWRRIERYDRTKSLVTTWIFNQAKFARLDLMRRDRSRSKDSNASDDIEELPSWDDIPDPLSDKERRALARAWRHLTATERAVLEERLVHEHSYDEIVDSLADTNLTRDHLRVFVHRSAAKLREFYENELLKGGA